MLRKRYDTIEEIPEAARRLYTQDGSGGYVLQVEGADDDQSKAKIREMRDNNIAMQKELAALREKVDALGDIDPQAVRAAIDSLTRQTPNPEEQSLMQSGKLDEFLQRRLRQGEEATQRKLQELEKQKQHARDRFASVFLAEQVAEALDRNKLRVRSTARTDLITRASQAFRPDEELQKLQTTIPDMDPSDGSPFTLDKWLTKLVDEAPHLFDGGNGGGARPGGGAGSTVSLKGLSPEEFTKAADAVNSGSAKWGT